MLSLNVRVMVVTCSCAVFLRNKEYKNLYSPKMVDTKEKQNKYEHKDSM